MHMSRNQKLFHKTEGYIWIRIIYCPLGGFTYEYINLVLDLYNQSDFTLNHNGNIQTTVSQVGWASD